MKTAELSGFDLDDSVRRALGGQYLGWTDPFMEFPADKWPLGADDQLVHGDAWSPSTDLEYGEPQGERGFGVRLIQALEIAVQKNTEKQSLGEWIAGLRHDGVWHQQYGATHLEAAMRVLVSSRLGDDVE